MLRMHGCAWLIEPTCVPAALPGIWAAGSQVALPHSFYKDVMFTQ